MFNYLENQKRKQKRTQKARIIFFSFMSSVVTAVIAIFFSQKENREKVVTGAKDLSRKAKDTTADLTSKVSKTSQDLTKKTIDLYEEYKSKLPSNKQIEEAKDEVVSEAKKTTKKAVAKTKPSKPVSK
jgi:hypothetical protein